MATRQVATTRSAAPTVRDKFLRDVQAILGPTARLWVCDAPTIDNTILRDAGPYFKSGSWDAADVAARISALGSGYAQTFNGSNQYGIWADAPEESFGNGAADAPLSIWAVANVTNTAARRTFAGKYLAAGSREYIFYVQTDDTLGLVTSDQSVPVDSSRASNSPITMGTWRTFGVSYSGVGGASNQNGSALYEQGVALASTPGNQATYVAMEDQAAEVNLGADSNHTAGFFQGSLAAIGITRAQLSAANFLSLHQLAQAFYGI